MIGIGLGIPGAARRLAAPFTPASLSPFAWYRSDLGVTLNGGNVSAWADQSGNGRHAIQTVAGNQPPYTASGGAGGRPYLTSVSASGRGLFAGAVTDWLALHSGAGMTVVVVVKCNAGPYGNYLLATQTSSGANRGFSLAQATSANVSATVGNGAAQVAIATGACGQGAVRRIVATYRTGVDPDLVLRVDGAQVATGSEVAAPSATDPPYTLGLGFSGAGGYPTDADWYEVLVFSRVLTAGEIAQLEAYLASRYT